MTVRGSGSKGSRAIVPSAWRQVPATAPSTRKVGNECGVRVEKMRGRKRSGRIPVRRAWTRSVASQVGRKRTGAGTSPAGRGAPGRREPLPSGPATSSQSASTGVTTPSARPVKLATSLRDAGPNARR